MKHLSKEDARKLAISSETVMSFFQIGYSETLKLTHTKLMNDKYVRPNDYFVNEDFSIAPQWFVAHYQDRIYRVLRVIYVREDLRGKGLGTDIINEIKKIAFSETFLQIGVESTDQQKFEKLDRLYKKMEFKRTPYPITHPDGRKFYDYFWSSRNFVVRQFASTIGAELI